MIIEALKSSGKISQGISLINKMGDVASAVIIHPDEVSTNSDLLLSIKNTLALTKQWISDIEDHLKFLEKAD